MRRISLAALAACVLVGAFAPASAVGGDSPQRPWLSEADGGSAESPGIRSAFSRQEDPPSDPGGLPAAAENIELVSELNPQHFGGVRIGEIADLAVHKGYAYLNSWDNEECDRGGVYVVDIRDVTAPKEVAYIPPKAGSPYYHGEGAHAITVDTTAASANGFKGDLLAVNNETFGSNVLNDCGPADVSRGGFDLYDVSNPANPQILVQGAGDTDNDTPDDPTDDLEDGNSYHSVFVWQAGPRAYLVASDNMEFNDVDIFDITDPRNPVMVADLDLLTLFPQIDDNEQTNGENIFNHDMVVKQIDGKFIMSVSYWDAGYVQIDVTDPANPKHVTDTTFGTDAFRAPLSSEGNAHYSEYSFDNQFLLAADEDFGTFRTTAVRVTSGPNAGDVVGVAGSDSIPVTLATSDGVANGPTRYVGTACDGETLPAPPAVSGDQEAFAVIERGVCDGGFAEKLENAAAAGYDAAIVFNQAGRADGDPLVSMSTGGATIPAVFIRRATAVGTATEDGRLFPGRAGATPAVGDDGEDFLFSDAFDGWGYARLYDAKTSELIDSYAIPESQDIRFAFGFGDLSIHEFATDPSEPIAYAAYYAGGMRTFRFSRAEGLVPTGKWIDDDGNGSNFWGVEVFNDDDQRYFAGSDRDFGLQIFRYTGAGAAQRPNCDDVQVTTRYQRAVSVPLTCTDPNSGNTLTLQIVNGPANGSLGAISGNTVTYTPKAGFFGTDSFTYTASDGMMQAAPATVQVTVDPPPYYGIKRKPRLTHNVTPKRDKKKPFIFRSKGRLILPSGMSKAEGCEGTVRIVARRKKTGKVLSRRRTGIKSTCKYKARARLRKTRVGKRGKAVFTARFLGNDVLLPANAKRVTVKYGSKKK